MQPPVPNHLPLRGIRVLDLSRVLAGPFCSMVLADLGAEVIKVERPGRGDDTRTWGPPFVDGESAYYLSVNRNKRSMTLELSRPEGREILEALIRRSDVLLENFLPDSAARLGLTTDRLECLNPRLVVCSITGFGQTGPWRETPGYDFVVQALSGLMSITGEPAGEPMKVGVAVTDVLTGLFAAVAIQAELLGRARGAQPVGGVSPEFRRIDLSLLDCTLASLVNVAAGCLASGARPPRFGNAHPHIVPYQCFETADGHLVLAVGNDEQWRRFCTVAGRSDLATDARFMTNPDRVAHRDDLVPQVAATLRGRTTSAWQAVLQPVGVPHAPVLGVDQALELPQVDARQMVVECRGAPGIRLVASPIRVEGRTPSPAGRPPRLGEHTDEVLGDLGYGRVAIERLREQGVI